MAEKKKPNKKILIAAGVGLAALAGWWLYNHFTAQSQIAMQPVVPPVPGTSSAAGAAPSALTVLPAATPIESVVTPAVVAVANSIPPAAPSQTATPSMSQMLTALQTAWAANIQVPAMGATMLAALTPDQVTGLYNILTTQWELGVPATPAHTAFWNALVQQYPFLRTGGVGCSSITSCP